MAYDVSGTFHEACDCEVICSCWVEIPPQMGTCTGLYIWNIDKASSIEGASATGALVAAISYGPSCDEAEALLLVLDVSGVKAANAVTAAQLEAAITSGPWSRVIHPPDPDMTLLPADKNIAKVPIFEVRTGTIKTLGGKTDQWRIFAPADPAKGESAIEVTALMNFDKAQAKLSGGPADGLLARTVGSSALREVTVGQIETGTPYPPAVAGAPGIPYGLDILADVKGTGGTTRRIDLDVTTVTAMRGQFQYVLP